MKSARFILLAGAVVFAPAFAAKPQIQWDQAFDFDQISTFMWQPSAGQTLQTADPFLHEHIINTIEFYLSDSGLTEVNSNPDILVTYYGDTQTEVSLQSDSYGYGWGTYGRGGWGYYGYGMGGPITTTTRVVEYERGTLVIDIVDAASSQLIWRGTVGDISISNNPEKMKKTITKAIARMVKQSQKLRAKAERD